MAHQMNNGNPGGKICCLMVIRVFENVQEEVN